LVGLARLRFLLGVVPVGEHAAVVRAAVLGVDREHVEERGARPQEGLRRVDLLPADLGEAAARLAVEGEALERAGVGGGGVLEAAGLRQRLAPEEGALGVTRRALLGVGEVLERLLDAAVLERRAREVAGAVGAERSETRHLLEGARRGARVVLVEEGDA